MKRRVNARGEKSTPASVPGSRRRFRADLSYRLNVSPSESYDWPGNIRELQNVIERAVIVSDSETLSIDERWLSGRRSSTPPTVATAPISTLATQEKDAIEGALAESKGRVSGPFGAASRLGVP